MSSHVPNRFVTAAALGGLLSMSAIATAQPGPAAQRALPPEAAALIQAAFGRADPPLRLAGASVAVDHVEARLCVAQSDCFSVRLSDPELGCASAPAGPWCLSFVGAPPSNAVASGLRRALEADSGKAIWVRTYSEKSAQPSATGAPSATSQPARSVPLLVASALLICPFLLGAALGAFARWKRKRRFQSEASFALVWLVPALFGSIVGLRFLLLGEWDVLIASLCFSGGLCLTGHARARLADRGTIALAASSLLVFTLILEIAVRAFLPPPPPINPGERLRLFLPQDDTTQSLHLFEKWRKDPRLEDALEAIYPARPPSAGRGPGLYEKRTAGAALAAHRVLHVGDSMVYGLGLPESADGGPSPAAIPHQLELLQPGVAHINAAVPGLSPDAYFLVARSWAARLHPELVVVYVFTGNDLDEMDDSYPFCAGGPLLSYEGNKVTERCPEPRPGGNTAGHFRWYLAHSPPPYPLRALAGVSRLAHHLTVAALGLRTRLFGSRNEETAWPHFELVMKALAEELHGQNIPLRVVVLPMRRALEAQHPEETFHYALRGRILDLCKKEGIAALDPWALIADKVRRDGVDGCFLNSMVSDFHFNAECSALVAGWLGQRLPAPARISSPPTPE